MKLKRINYGKELRLISRISIWSPYVIKETKLEIKIQEPFMNSQSLMLPICSEFWILWLEIHFSLSIEKRGKLLFRCCVFWNTINLREQQDPIKKKKWFSNSPEYFHLYLFCIVLAAWPSGKAGDCKSFLPSSNPGVAWLTKDSEFLTLLN